MKWNCLSLSPYGLHTVRALNVRPTSGTGLDSEAGTRWCHGFAPAAAFVFTLIPRLDSRVVWRNVPGPEVVSAENFAGKLIEPFT